MLFQKAHKKTERTDRKNEIKKERKRSPWHFTDPFPPTNGVNPRLSEKVSFCALETRIKRASIAVETVLVLPLFFLGMITMISFMDVYNIFKVSVRKPKKQVCMPMWLTIKDQRRLLCLMYIPIHQ